MALGKYQQTSLTHAGSILQGGFRLGVAASAASFVASVGTVLGIGNLTSFTENIEKTTTQAGNSDMPEPAIANHTVTVAFELLEFWPLNFAMARGSGAAGSGGCDIMNSATASVYITGTGTANVFSTGGLSVLTPKAFCFENTTLVSGATAVTKVIVYKARLESGMAFTPKSDHDTDPAMVIPFTLTGNWTPHAPQATSCT